jgi:tetratricopeptide (TPR) repeat protein
MKRGLGFLILCAVLHSIPGWAETRWTVVRTPTLAVVGDQSARTLRRVAIQIEQFRTVISELFGKGDAPRAAETRVFVFGERRSALPFVPLVNGKPAEIAGFFTPGQDFNTIVIALDAAEEASRIVYHEYTHLLVGNAVRAVPVWLNEGLAEFYSTYTPAADGKSAQIGRPVAAHIQLLRGRYAPLADIIAVDRTSALYNESDRRTIFYAESWALVHYLLTEMKGGGAAINTYAAAIADGAAPADAFRTAFGTTPVEFDRQLRSYMQRMIFGVRRFEFDAKLADPSVSAPAVIATVEADAWLGDLQRRIGREEEGTKRIESAAASNPSAAAGQLALGLLRLSQARDEEGMAALKRAADLAPTDYTTQLTYGLSVLRSADRPEPQAAAALAIPSLKRAIEARPDSAEALAWMAYAQMQDSSTLDAARMSIERAIALAPGQSRYRLRWADIRIEQGAYDEAERVLKGITAAGAWDPTADAAEATMEMLGRRRRRDAMDATEAALAAKASEHLGGPGSDRAPAHNGRLILDLRKVQPGEARVLGFLVRIDCGASEVRFEVRSPDGTFVATAPRMEDVDLVSYLNDKDFTITCGPRPEPARVLLTWTPDPSPSPKRAGRAVAVEFVPKDFTP